MSGVELKFCDGEAKNNILLPIGKTVIGRGPFLSVADKRVSRNHAVLEVDDGKLKIMSTHTNPTFYLEGASENLSPLPKDIWHNLGNGDRFALLPDQHIYEVVIDDRPINKDSQGFTLNTTLSPTKNKEELEKEEDMEHESEEGENKKNGESSTPQENKSNGQQKGNEHDTEEDKEEDQTAEIKEEEDENVVVLPSGKSVALPLNKPRNMPSWMLGSDTTPTTKDSPKGRGRGRGKKSTSSDEVLDATASKPKPKGRGRGRGKKTDTTSKPTPRKVPKREIEYLDDWMGSDDEDADDDDEGSDWEEENKKEQAKRRGSQSRFPRSPTKKSPRKRSKKTSSDEEIDDLMDEEVYIPRPTKRGRIASRSSYSQSVEEDDEEDVKPKKDEKEENTKEETSQEKQRTACTYGKKCYRKNQKHFDEFSHPGDDDYPDEEAADNKDEEGEEDQEEDLPECPYGTDCYRKNKSHFKEYKHNKKEVNTRPRRQASEVAKKKVNACEETDEEEDGPNTYDKNDSFIEASEQSPYEPASEESDVNPDEDSEDVRTLRKEAKGFIKNKKMQKKVR